jgi:hypothetical protein
MNREDTKMYTKMNTRHWIMALAVGMLQPAIAIIIVATMI